MSFHRWYALKGFFGGDDNNENEGATGDIELPDNAALYYFSNAESVLDSNSLNFETSAVAILQE